MSEENVKTFVVLDLETNGLPSQQFNTCSITELSLYAFSAKYLIDKDIDIREIIKNDIEEGICELDQQPPELPRVLHKLTLMINPRRFIQPTAERVTGLSNEMLENESSFDKNTAECLQLFLERLEKPICMVAHNGWSFDYPIIRHVHEKINMCLSSSIYCVDSLKAFREIDEKRQQIEKAKQVLKIIDTMENEDENKLKKQQQEQAEVNDESNSEDDDVLNTITSDPLEQSSLINWQRVNETTPHRKKKAEKRSHNALTNEDSNSSSSTTSSSLSPAHKRKVSLSVRRSLFSDNFIPKTKYPPKGVYKLGNIYERVFQQAAVNLHRAETDVEILTKLILYYGLDFLAYAEERKQPFAAVPKLGSRDNW